MKILIIVPTLNSYNYLPKLVASLDSQTFKEWRVVFVDGKSSEKHRNWLKSLCLSKRQYDYIEQKKSRGIFGAMNEGLELALNDEWVFFWGSDDWLPNSQTLENLNKSINFFSIEENSNNFVVCYGKYYDLRSSKLGRISSFSDSENQIISGREFRDKLMDGFSPPHQGFLFPPSNKKQRFYYNEQFKIASDLEMFLRISKNDKNKFLILNLNLVCMGDQGISSKAIMRKYFEVLKAYKYAFGKFFLLVFFKRYYKRLMTLIN